MPTEVEKVIELGAVSTETRGSNKGLSDTEAGMTLFPGLLDD